jgi:hypothetical protein
MHGGAALTASPKTLSSTQVGLIREGAADAIALLGLVRLAEFLARPEHLGTEQPCEVLVDSGTGVTAVGEVPIQAGARDERCHTAFVVYVCNEVGA